MDGEIKPEARRKAREVALQVLYAVDHSEGIEGSRRKLRRDQAEASAAAEGPLDDDYESHPQSPRIRPESPSSPEEVFEEVATNFELPGDARKFARELALGVHSAMEDIDVLVSANARNWRIDRMAIVDRNILRLATYELSRTDTPTPVILDEAVNLARRFGDIPSPSFVNGILDAIAHGVRPSEP